MDPDPDPKFLISTRGSRFGSVINNFGSGTLAVVMILFLLSFYRVKARGLGRRIAWLDAHLYGKTEGRVSSTQPAGGSAHSGQDVPGSRPHRLLHLHSSIFGLHNNVLLQFYINKHLAQKQDCRSAFIFCWCESRGTMSSVPGFLFKNQRKRLLLDKMFTRILFTYIQGFTC